MTSSNTQSHTAAPQTSEAAVETVKTLYGELQDMKDGSQIAEARDIAKRIAVLVDQVAGQAPNSEEHAEALAFHEYTLLKLATLVESKEESQSLKRSGYEKGGASVTIKLQAAKPELGAVFAAYNLGIDLIVTEKRSQDGLDWMFKSRALLTRLAGKKKLPQSILEFKLFDLDYGIAQAYFDLGRRDLAKRMLKRSLSRAPALNQADWSTLRAVAKCSELLAQIKLDERLAEMEAKKSA